MSIRYFEPARRHFIRGAGAGVAFWASSALAQTPGSRQDDVGPSFLDKDYLAQVAIAEEAYIWGYPIVQIAETRKTFQRLGLPSNRLIFSDNYLVEGSYDPSTELLYGWMYVDLSSGPMVLTVPDTQGRYYSFQFNDPYSNITAYVSTRTNQGKPGSYALVGPDWNGRLPKGVQRISSNQNKLYCLVRVFVAGSADIKNALAVQAKFRVGPLSDYPNRLAAPQIAPGPLMMKSVPMFRFESFGPQYFDLLGEQLAELRSSPEDQKLLARFATIGIGPGLRPSMTKDAEALQALRDGMRLGETKIVTSNFAKDVNGWWVRYGIGQVIENPVLRAASNRLGTGFHIAQEAMYFVRTTGPDGKPLSGKNKYRLRFPAGGLPPVNAFWSLSLMKSDALLIKNPINRSSIAGHTPGLRFGPDGSLEIEIQNEQPASGTANWLPSGPGPFRLNLRLYLPKEAVIKGDYAPPQIEVL